MNSPKSISVFLLDDHEILLEGLSILINKEQDMHVCGTATDIPSGISKLFDIQPDIAIVDLTLENSNGMDFIKSTKARYPDTHVLVLSMHDEIIFAERNIRAGASGYIMKSEKPSVIIEAIRKIISGKVYLSPQMTQYVVKKALNSKDKWEEDIIETLSDREFQIFQYIGDGITSKQMAQNLNLSIKTIDSLRENIKHKLGLESASELTRYAIKWVHSENSL